MDFQNAVPMIRCRVSGAGIHPFAAYVAAGGFDAWRDEMEQRYRRVITVEEFSTWVPESDDLHESVADPDTLHGVLQVRFQPPAGDDAAVAVVRYVASDSYPEATAVRLARLPVTPGYFLSATPVTPYVLVDEDDAYAERLVAEVA
jgi:hypothetical protein